MTALDANPATHDNLLPNRFRLQLKRAPNLDFWLQETAIPGFEISPTGQPNPFVEIPKSGDHIEYEPLGVTFIVDNQLANYLEIFNWLTSLGFPDSFDEYASLVNTQRPPVLDAVDAGITSEINLFVLNGSQQPKFRFHFSDAFPFAIGKLMMTSTDADLNRVVCYAAFKFTSFHVYPVV